MTLAPCTACGRHVKDRDCRCPFCGAKVACLAASAPDRIERVARSSLLAASALGAALAVTDCGSSPTLFPPYGAGPPPPADAGQPPPPTDAGKDAERTEASSASDARGDQAAPPIDASDASDGSSPSDAGDESPRILPPYGGPPP